MLKFTLPPHANVVAPPAVIVGVGTAIETAVVAEVEAQVESKSVTTVEYEPLVFAEILCVVALPGDHKYEYCVTGAVEGVSQEGLFARVATNAEEVASVVVEPVPSFMLK